jgi:hypothetical protein
MNDPTQNSFSNHPAAGRELSPAEATLRLIARLPAPEGLEERVRAGLAAAPPRSRILAWPVSLSLHSGWMRAAAAAAIVCVVAGGGWAVYSRVERPQPARVIVLAPRGPAQGGFSSAGAVRTPQTLNGPVVAHPAPAQPVESKVPAKNAQKPIHRAPPAPAGKASDQPVAPPAK